jgi:putative SOS response-associated peptidase YedK
MSGAVLAREAAARPPPIRSTGTSAATDAQNMCGRFALFAEPKAAVSHFELPELPLFEARYNIAPTQAVLVIRDDPLRGGRAAARMRWGLIPSWAADASMGAGLINARAETAAEKPAFRAAFRQRRCLIPASGFYEWRTVKRKKQPYFLHPRDGLFGFAGLWETWTRGSDAIDSCTILTTTANEVVQPFHERMPVILPHADWTTWLDAGQVPTALTPLLRPFPNDAMSAFPVDPCVNSVRNDSPECVARVAELFSA